MVPRLGGGKLEGGTDPVGPLEGKHRVPRSGCWSISADDCRSAKRGGNDPSLRLWGLGFRVALSPVADAPGKQVGLSVAKPAGDSPKDLNRAAVEIVIRKKAQAIITHGGKRKLIENVTALPSEGKYEFRGFVTSGVR